MPLKTLQVEGMMPFTYTVAKIIHVSMAWKLDEWNESQVSSSPLDLDGSDEVHFWLNGYVNKQNCHIWSEANPQVYVETPLHPEKLTVWCALWAGGIIGP
ncbi:hypothetical protein TNCV_562111 [Trichonephila clavipes]|uniref:Uncharacterized protein n=1 Tax=Trichonephila clavipes TaxID=2585209 RepID=A0A8X6VF33_TRICX|nr:hypothetical protein TNCV_562111 [Trichonephila clavipes]